MVTQDRLIVCKSGKYEIYNLDEVQEQETLFQFKEFEQVSLRLDGSKKSYIEFECADRDALCRLKKDDGVFVLNNYDYNQDETKNVTFYPSKYYMSIHCNNRTIECNFDVESNALGNKVDDIRKIVSDFSKGLELDIVSDGKARAGRKVTINQVMPLLDLLAEHEKMLQFEIQHVLSSPIETLEKVFVYSPVEKKVVKQSILYNVKKGIVANSGRKTIQEKKITSLNNKENMLLKRALYQIVDRCQWIFHHVDESIALTNAQLKKKQSQFVELTQKKKNADKNPNDRRYYARITAEYEQMMQEIQKLQQELYTTKQKLEAIRRIRNCSNRFLMDSWLANIPKNHDVQYSLTLLHEPHYKKIIDFTNALYHEQSESLVKPSQYTFKKTSQLYELYVLILILNMLKKEGYVLDAERSSSLYALSEDEQFYLHKDHKTIRIVYDRMIKDTDEYPSDELVNQNSISNRPDLVFMVYEDDVLQHCIIVEVKCRKKNNIYQPTMDTPVMKQLKDYTNFWYFNNDLVLKKGVIDRVYLIFPQEELCKEYYNANQIGLLSLKPVYRFEEDKSYQSFIDEFHQYL